MKLFFMKKIIIIILFFLGLQVESIVFAANSCSVGTSMGAPVRDVAIGNTFTVTRTTQSERPLSTPRIRMLSKFNYTRDEEERVAYEQRTIRDLQNIYNKHNQALQPLIHEFFRLDTVLTDKFGQLYKDYEDFIDQEVGQKVKPLPALFAPKDSRITAFAKEKSELLQEARDLVHSAAQMRYKNLKLQEMLNWEPVYLQKKLEEIQAQQWVEEVSLGGILMPDGLSGATELKVYDSQQPEDYY